MVAYNFQEQFAPAVERLEKRQTIRANGRRRHARPGEHVQLYTGQRTRACRKLVNPDPVCTAALPVEIAATEAGRLEIRLDGELLSGAAAEAFARADGFASVAELGAWFEQVHGLPFRGTCIQWTPVSSVRQRPSF